MGYILWFLCAESLYSFNLLLHFDNVFFSFLFWLCHFFKNRIFFWVCLSIFFVFYLNLIKLESGFQKIYLFSFNLGLMRFGYRGFLS